MLFQLPSFSGGDGKMKVCWKPHGLMAKLLATAGLDMLKLCITWEMRQRLFWVSLKVAFGSPKGPDLSPLTSLSTMLTSICSVWSSRSYGVIFSNFSNLTFFRLAFEFPAVGGVLPSQKLTTVKLLKYTTPADFLLLSCECIFIIYILYYIVEESLEIKVHGFKYFFNLWNILDLVVIAVSFMDFL